MRRSDDSRASENGVRSRPIAPPSARFADRQGMLICYHTNTTDLFRRAAEYVGRILKGASPSTLPVGQPRTFELIVNVKSAKPIRLTIRKPMLDRADEVIW